MMSSVGRGSSSVDRLMAVTDHNQFINVGKESAFPLTTSTVYNYQNTLPFFHFHTNIKFLKRMERKLLRLTLRTRFRIGFWSLYSADV